MAHGLTFKVRGFARAASVCRRSLRTPWRFAPDLRGWFWCLKCRPAWDRGCRRRPTRYFLLVPGTARRLPAIPSWSRATGWKAAWQRLRIEHRTRGCWVFRHV